MLLIVQGAISQGLLWAIMAIGVYLTFRILETPDLSVEGTIILGAATAARLIAEGINPFLATLIAMLAGCIGGLITGLLHTKLKIPPILAGILTMVASYSIVIRIMNASNIPLPPLRVTTVFTFLQNMGLARTTSVIVFGAIAVVVVGVLLYCFLGTELGSALRATGNNSQMVKAQGINTNVTVIAGLMISNGLVGLTGALVAQQQGFASVDMGVGTIVIGLASVIIAEVLFRVRNVWSRLISIVFGAIIYRLIIALVLELGMAPTDLRLFQAITVAFALALPLIREAITKIKPRDRRG